MRISIFPTGLCLCLVLSGSSLKAQETEVEAGVMPLPARELWAVMPGKLKTWKLLKSTAETRMGVWLESRAVREYEKEIDESSPAKGLPPARARLTITDTGRHPEVAERFADFVPGKEDGFEKRIIESYPAFVIPGGKQGSDLEILVADRFLIEISIENQPTRFLEEWLQRIDLAALAAVPTGEMVSMPEVVTIIRLDQLKPERNRAYRLATTSKGRLTEELEQDDAWLRSVIGVLPEIPDSDSGSDPEVRQSPKATRDSEAP